MFSGFNLSITEDFFGSYFDKLVNYADEIGNKGKKAKENITEIINNDCISASLLSEDWFPQVNVDFFISHSSKDKELAYALAGWLYQNFGIVSFIDSIFWNYAGELLNKINNEFSDPCKTPTGGYLYSYQKCNKASEHVNIILNAALYKLIDKTEAVFFLNTNNSTQVFNHSDNVIPVTYSPWIFSEILCTQIVRKKPLYQYRQNYNIPSNLLEHSNFSEEIETRALEIEYKIPLSHLEKISGDKLNEWRNMDKSRFFGYPLDGLYYLSDNYFDDLRDTRTTVAIRKGIPKADFFFS